MKFQNSYVGNQERKSRSKIRTENGWEHKIPDGTDLSVDEVFVGDQFIFQYWLSAEFKISYVGIRIETSCYELRGFISTLYFHVKYHDCYKFALIR